MLTLDRGITSHIRLKGFGLVWHLVRKLDKNASYVMLIRYSIIPYCKHVKRYQTKEREAIPSRCIGNKSNALT